MTKEGEQDSPDAWVPGVLGMVNEKGLREEHRRRWEEEAHVKNKARSLGQKLSGRDRTGAEEVMIDEAHRINERFDKEKPGVPYPLYHQKLSEGILAESGIDPHKKFKSSEELETALGQSDVPYHERTHRAAVKIRPESGQEDKVA